MLTLIRGCYLKWPLSCDNILYGTIALNSESANSSVRVQFAGNSICIAQQLDGEMYNDNIAFAYSDSTDHNLYTD